MDWLWQVLIVSFFLILGAIIWNSTIAKDESNKNNKKPDNSNNTNKIIDYFIEKYHFQKNNDLISGYVDKRLIRIFLFPLRAVIELQNQKGLSILLEQDYGTPSPLLIDTPINGLKDDFVFKSNYPMLAAQVMTEDLIKEINSFESFSFFLDNNALNIRFGSNSEARGINDLVRFGVKLANNVEALSYAYSQ